MIYLIVKQSKKFISLDLSLLFLIHYFENLFAYKAIKYKHNKKKITNKQRSN